MEKYSDGVTMYHGLRWGTNHGSTTRARLPDGSPKRLVVLRLLCSALMIALAMPVACTVTQSNYLLIDASNTKGHELEELRWRIWT